MTSIINWISLFMLPLEAIAMPHTLIKTDIHLTVFDQLVYREIQLLALTLMTSRKARAPELRMITRDSYWNDKAPFLKGTDFSTDRLTRVVNRLLMASSYF